jgi:recombination protein RecA
MKKGSWLDALGKQKLEVKSAADALQVKGWLDTGNYALNWAISGRLLNGYPLGHTVEIFGDPATGKSFLIARAIAMAQAAGGVAMLDDTEGAYNLAHIGTLGVNVDNLAYRNSRTVKQHLDTALAFLGAYKSLGITTPGILACDSLAQLSTEHELETKLDKRDMTKAAELKAFFRIVSGDLFDYPVLHVSANHTIAAIGSLFKTRDTPGGGGPKFQASVRLDLRATSKIKQGNEYIGTICRVFVEKNKTTAPWKETRMAIPFNKPISRASGLIPLLMALGVLAETGQFVEYQGKRLGRTYKSKDNFLEQDEVAEQMLDQWPEILEQTDAALEAGKLQKTAVQSEEAVTAADE